MAFQNISMNLTALQSITPPNISISGTGVFSNIVSSANAVTGDYIIFATLFIILIVMYLTLSDKTPLQEFGYDDMRALNIAFNSSTLIGMTTVSVGWSNNFFAIGMFTTLWLVSLIVILIYDSKGTE